MNIEYIGSVPIWLILLALLWFYFCVYPGSKEIRAERAFQREIRNPPWYQRENARRREERARRIARLRARADALFQIGAALRKSF